MRAASDFELEAPPAGKPKRSRAKPKSFIPDDFALTDKMRRTALELGMPAKVIDFQFQRFCNNARTNDRMVANWVQAWRGWVLVYLDPEGKFNNSSNSARAVGPDGVRYNQERYNT